MEQVPLLIKIEVSFKNRSLIYIKFHIKRALKRIKTLKRRCREMLTHQVPSLLRLSLLKFYSKLTVIKLCCLRLMIMDKMNKNSCSSQIETILEIEYLQ
jgi:hypothetical protein